MFWSEPSSLVLRIAIGVLLGVVVALLFPSVAVELGLLGTLFVGLLKAIAPMLVMLLVTSALANLQQGETATPGISMTLGLYLVGTIGAALTALLLSYLFPQTLHLQGSASGAPPGSVVDVLSRILIRMVENPIKALIEANFLACLLWGVLFGLSLRQASDSIRSALSSLAERITSIVRWIINLAPLGILGLVANTVAEVGAEALLDYLSLAGVLVLAMLVVAFGVNAALVALVARVNPFPLIWLCLKESGVTAFFTRSSAANIPINLALAQRMQLSSSLYSVTIPVGATINMAGAAITITTLTLAACGASGVPSGSLLLIPLACGLFGISTDIAMQVVAVGFVISVIQDSAETALNSSTDVVFTAAVDRRLAQSEVPL